MINRQLIPYLQLIHGSFNLLTAILFTYQGAMGFKIRGERRKGSPMPLAAIKRHRKLGPILTPLGIAGFFAGLTLVYIDAGDILKYPAHLAVGIALCILIGGAFLVSRRIKGSETTWRNPHFIIGIFILIVYYSQILLGLGVLL